MISVIIPTLNEAASLGPLLAALACEPAAHEIIVVDGGSSDGTPDLARQAGIEPVAAPRGRGQQLAAGAALARGDVLLFLHADTVFPPGGLAAINRALREQPSAPGGNFRILFDGGSDFAAWLNDFYALIRRIGLYYGDSGIFVRRDVYEAIGGVRPIALMEDYDLVWRLRRHGKAVCITDPPIVSSARRFAGRRKWAIVTGWLAIHVLWHLGIPASTLAWLYNSRRDRRPWAMSRRPLKQDG